MTPEEQAQLDYLDLYRRDGRMDRRHLPGHCPQCGEASCSIEGPHTWYGLRRWVRVGTYWPFVDYGRWPCCHRRRPHVAR